MLTMNVFQLAVETEDNEMNASKVIQWLKYYYHGFYGYASTIL